MLHQLKSFYPCHHCNMLMMAGYKEISLVKIYAKNKNFNIFIFIYLPATNLASNCDLENYCNLISVCVPIDGRQTHTTKAFYPRCVKLFRCVQSCCNYSTECKPHSEIIEKNVRKFH